ncbi:MAG: hypothetical protein JWN04_1629 [Myxococcaceae bacterium]|nr:hypothetical protein [Myxococcaceae bacterium]
MSARVPRLAYAAGSCGLAVFLVSLVAPRLSVPPMLAFATAYAAVTLEILTLAWAAEKASVLRVSIGCGLCLAVLLGLARAPASAPFAAVLTCALGAGASLLGAAVGGRIERPGQLAAVALVSGVADLWSVFDPSAPSARFAEQALAHPDQLALFALPFPLLGTTWLPAIIGAGDVAFAALYVAAFRAHALSARRAALALLVAFVIGLVVLVLTLRPIPLLPLLGLAVVLSEPAARSLTGREWRTVSLVCAAMISAIALRLSR